MSLHILQAIQKTNDQIPRALKPAIAGHVAMAQRNHAEITGRRRNKNFFHAEGSLSDETRSRLFPRTFNFYMAFGLANRVSGDLIDQEFRSWSELRRQLQGELPLRAAGGLWKLQESVDAQLNALRSAIVSDNRIEARFMLVQMSRDIEIMLRLCDQELSMPLIIGAR